MQQLSLSYLWREILVNVFVIYLFLLQMSISLVVFLQTDLTGKLNYEEYKKLWRDVTLCKVCFAIFITGHHSHCYYQLHIGGWFKWKEMMCWMSASRNCIFCWLLARVPSNGHQQGRIFQQLWVQKCTEISRYAVLHLHIYNFIGACKINLPRYNWAIIFSHPPSLFISEFLQHFTSSFTNWTLNYLPLQRLKVW